MNTRCSGHAWSRYPPQMKLLNMRPSRRAARPSATARTGNALSSKRSGTSTVRATRPPASATAMSSTATTAAPAPGWRPSCSRSNTAFARRSSGIARHSASRCSASSGSAVSANSSMFRCDRRLNAIVTSVTSSTGMVGRRRLQASAATTARSASRKILPLMVWKSGDMNSCVCRRIALLPKKPNTCASSRQPIGLSRLLTSATASAAAWCFARATHIPRPVPGSSPSSASPSA